jgi:hypothetical protein
MNYQLGGHTVIVNGRCAFGEPRMPFPQSLPVFPVFGGTFSPMYAAKIGPYSELFI